MYLGAGSGGQGLERLSLSAEDLVMAMHKASSRRIEVLSRTTGNVDQVGSSPVVPVFPRDPYSVGHTNYARGVNKPRSCNQAFEPKVILIQEHACMAYGRDVRIFGTIWHSITGTPQPCMPCSRR